MDTGAELTVYCGVVDISPQMTPMASALNYGSGSPGMAGVPALSAIGVPSLGNATFGVTVTNGLTGEMAAFYVSGYSDYVDMGSGQIQWINIPQFDIFPGMVSLQVIASNTATQMMAIPSVPGLAGYLAYVQVIVGDPLNPNGIASSDALLLTLN